MDPNLFMRMAGAWQGFQQRHPKVIQFFRSAVASGVPEGSVVEISIKRPGQDEMVTNLRVLPEDKEFLDMLTRMS